MSKQDKPREFWIDPEYFANKIGIHRAFHIRHDKNECYQDSIHVIEYSAYEAAQAEIERINSYTIPGYEQVIKEAKAESERHRINYEHLVKVKKHYFDEIQKYKKLCEMMSKVFTHIFNNKNSNKGDWHKAREALLAYNAAINPEPTLNTHPESDQEAW